MKKILAFALLLSSQSLPAQQVLNNCIISIKNTTTSESGSGFSNTSESTSKLYLKDSLIKMELDAGVFKQIGLTNNNSGIVSTLYDTDDGKIGYMSNKEQRLMMKARLDSILKERQQSSQGSSAQVKFSGLGEVSSIDYSPEEKTINGIACKKAIVTTKDEEGNSTKVAVWYLPSHILPAGANMIGSRLKTNDLKGIPIMYETVQEVEIGGNSITISSRFEVTSIEFNAVLNADTFLQPPGYKMSGFDDWIKKYPTGTPMGQRMRITQ